MIETLAVGADELRSCVENVFQAYGLPPEDAWVVADNLVDADLRGVHSHGVWRVAPYVEMLRQGTAVAQPSLTWVRDEGPQAVLDAGRALGQVGALAAVRELLARAGRFGLAAIAVRNNTHIGTLAYWARMAAGAGCVGIVVSNAGIHMAPWGGREKLVGNNPLAIAAPTARGWALALDMAMSVAAGGKITVAKLRGTEVPLGWGLDTQGRPTTDPHAVHSLLPMGAHKGYGLAVMLDVLAGVLSGGRFGAMLGLPGHSQFLLALQIERYLPLAEFYLRLDQVIDQIQESPPAVGGERLYLPGEIEQELRQRRLHEGIPLDAATLDSLRQESDRAGVAWELQPVRTADRSYV